MSDYAWIIVNDSTADTAYPEATNMNSRGVVGPHNAPDTLVAQLRKGKGRAFRMYDDDGELYYSGRIIGSEEFEPLDDFGAPNAGCTEIRYRNPTTNKWETL